MTAPSGREVAAQHGDAGVVAERRERGADDRRVPDLGAGEVVTRGRPVTVIASGSSRSATWCSTARTPPAR